MKIKNKLSNLAWRRLRSRGLLVAVGAAALLAAACADDDLATDKSNKHTGTALAFNVSDVQMDALAQNGAEQTRGLSMQPIPASYLAPRKIDATGSNPHDFCLIESTVEGLNPVKVDAKTRGTILTAGTLGTFSSIGYRAASPTAAAQPSTALLWFHGEKTNPDGTLQRRYDWDWPVNVYGRFYAVSPEATAANGITLSPSNYAQVPYVDFEVKSNVVDQVDLMTACSGEVHYEHGNDPTSNLKFTHALAAVKFSIGSNLSPVIIKKIEVSGVKYKGRYKLPNKADGSDAAWISVDNATTTMTLDNINVNAAEMPNTMLAGALNPATNPNNRPGREAYTFLMIPQTLPAKGAANHAKVTIYYQDGPTTKHVSFPLTGEWKANTTQEYKLSQRNSTWEIRLSVAGTSKTFDYQGNLLMGGHTFDVTSYRQSPDGTIQQAVPWKVSKYEEWDYTLNGGAGDWVDKGTTKPSWIGNFTDHGDGGTVAEVVNTTVKAAPVTDKLAAYNQVLKDATPKGTATNPYNLANPGGNGARNFIEESANCYLISAPGHYCIPLVYGNSIKNNQWNTKAYQSSQPAGTPYLLKTFKDHRDGDIVNPWIGQQQGGGPDDAKIVWMDQPNLVRSSSLQIVHSPDYLEFEVKKEDIRNGNAVIAVTRGTEVVWSWHLWFDHADALDKIPCKNYGGITYKFTRKTLGQVHIKYEKTSYDQPRKARITIEQQAGNGGVRATAPLVITQNPENENQMATTLYQFGRKDALPGTDAIAEGSYSFDNTSGGRSLGYAIQHPENMFIQAGTFNSDWCNATYDNLWSADNTVESFNDNLVVKTVYDPCPAGFHMPASNAFTGFATTTGLGTSTQSEFNVSGDWDMGWNFKAGGSSTATVYFPASGLRDSNNGSLYGVGTVGTYRSAVPLSLYTGASCILYFQQVYVGPRYNNPRSQGYSVRPVAE